MVWHWPQYVVGALMLFSLVAETALHGKAFKYNGCTAVLDFLLMAILLWCGGFWTPQ